jgi:hypothetical protein
MTFRKKRRLVFPNVFLFLHHNAPAGSSALATQNIVAYLAFHCLDHPPHYPERLRRITALSMD